MSILMSDSLNDKLSPFATAYMDNPKEQDQYLTLPMKVVWDETDFMHGELVTASFSNDNSLTFISLRVSSSPLAFLLSGKKVAFIEFCDVGYNYDMQDKQTSINVSNSLDSYILEIILENNNE